MFSNRPVFSSNFVALLAEGVDRNALPSSVWPKGWMSPSSRRAWIEISRSIGIISDAQLSPSSRRAWIEICDSSTPRMFPIVALLAEGVDRNTYGYSM